MKISPDKFTWRAYEQILDTCINNDYCFINFNENVSNGSYIMLRHDIDYDPDHALPISKLEWEKGIKASYFFQIDSPYYQFNSLNTSTIIEQLLLQGHWLGLHFDANKFNDDNEIIDRIEKNAQYLENKFGTKISAVSFHMPGCPKEVRNIELASNRINTYSSQFFKEIEYISDSNQNWRKNIYKIFQERQCDKIQLLTHPMWWRENYKSLYCIIEELADKCGISVSDILTTDQWALINKTV